MIRIESAGFYGLRHPEMRKEGVSSEYYNGYLNGQIEAMDQLRMFFERAVLEIRRESIKEQIRKEERENADKTN